MHDELTRSDLQKMQEEIASSARRLSEAQRLRRLVAQGSGAIERREFVPVDRIDRVGPLKRVDARGGAGARAHAQRSSETNCSSGRRTFGSFTSQSPST